MKKVPVYKRWLSFLFPVRIWQGKGNYSPVLDLYLFRNRWQLASATVLYSDGRKYRPLVKAFRFLSPRLGDWKNVLILGAGLGSAAQILRHMRADAHITLVDIDEVIVKLGNELLADDLAATVDYLCSDARAFIEKTSSRYDAIVIDIFLDREVPGFVCDMAFLADCRSRLAPGGTIIINYIINRKDEWEHFLADMKSMFRDLTVLDLGVNRVLLAGN